MVVPAGWFSLNVPSGLTLYWLVNNVISTGQQVYMKKTIRVDVPELAGATTGGAAAASATAVKPKEDRTKKVWL